MSEKKESLDHCSCFVYTSGYGSSVHYYICPRCSDRGFYRSSMTRAERLARERKEHITSVQAYKYMLKTEAPTDANEEFRALLRSSIAADIRKIREISKEIGPIRPVISSNQNDHE